MHYIKPSPKAELTLLPVWLTAALFFSFEQHWLIDPAAATEVGWLLLMFGWLFVVILLAAFAVVRHAEGLATMVGEPFGTLILTLSVITIEVAMISAVMLSGGDNPTLARDTMYAVIMIVMNGLVGLALLIGGFKHREQAYNLQGANAFLAIILPLSIIGLVLPNYTHATDDPSFSTAQAIFVGAATLLLYGVFLAMQTGTHRHYFRMPRRFAVAEDSAHGAPVPGARLIAIHATLLLAYLLPVVLLAKKIAVPVDFGIDEFKLPAALGGLIVAVLILAPEALGAIRAAVRNQLQRAVNIFLGSAAATIGLTVPAILIIAVVTDERVILGLDTENVLMLVTTLAVSMITFSSRRTNVLLGAVHLVLFGFYILLIFD